ncbi:MAG: hypothetical protein JNJ54_27910 [Myxococcaceae bacterium]|nr:hypothetical protein [Myxococcaceae bacterium]
MDDAWLEVRQEARVRLQPRALRWAVDPGVPAHVTVECVSVEGNADLAVQAGLQAALAATRDVETLSVRGLPREGGRWLDGAVARWVSSEGLHVTGRFRLMSSRCDVHAWGPAAGGAALAARLETLVTGFSSDRPALTEAVGDLTRFLAEHPAAVARSQAMRDAGLSDVVGMVLMKNALAHLEPERLAERFRLRLELLRAMAPAACGQMVQQRLEPSPALLDSIPESSAVRWVQLTHQALTQSLSATDPLVLPDEAEVVRAIEGLAEKDEAFRAALMTLKEGARVAPELSCEAERVRLERVLAQPQPIRTLLLRSLVVTK